MAWLKELTWPVGSAVLDGEVCAGDGHEGIQSVFEARGKAGSDLSFVAFDLLPFDRRPVVADPSATGESAWRT